MLGVSIRRLSAFYEIMSQVHIDEMNCVKQDVLIINHSQFWQINICYTIILAGAILFFILIIMSRLMMT